MKPIQTFGEIKSGKLLIHKRRELNRAISLSEDCDIELVIKKKHRDRSNQQNRYYWGVVVPIWAVLLTDSQGYHFSNDDAHEFLKLAYNYRGGCN